MKKILLTTSTLLTLFTIAGVVLVLVSLGRYSAGYAIIPMVFAIASTTAWKRVKKK